MDLEVDSEGDSEVDSEVDLVVDLVVDSVVDSVVDLEVITTMQLQFLMFTRTLTLEFSIKLSLLSTTFTCTKM